MPRRRRAQVAAVMRSDPVNKPVHGRDRQGRDAAQVHTEVVDPAFHAAGLHRSRHSRDSRARHGSGRWSPRSASADRTPERRQRAAFAPPASREDPAHVG
jgi:hypothetical protein